MLNEFFENLVFFFCADDDHEDSRVKGDNADDISEVLSLSPDTEAEAKLQYYSIHHCALQSRSPLSGSAITYQ